MNHPSRSGQQWPVRLKEVTSSLVSLAILRRALFCGVESFAIGATLIPALARPPQPAADAVAGRVDEYVSQVMQARHSAGLSLAVVKQGRIIKAGGYGFANVEHRVPASGTTVYRIASVTKTFTAAAIMLLAQGGKVRLDDRISRYFPDFPASWHYVTVRHLLTHTSGIKDYIDEVRRSPFEDTTPDEIIRSLAAEPLNFQPGEKWKYSNTGYLILGQLIQRVSGKAWDDYLDERIFAPLGMAATRRHIHWDPIPGLASRYDWRDNSLRNALFLNSTVWDNADGGLCSTVLDLAKWDASLYTESVLKRESLEQLWTPTRLNGGTTVRYGLGWDIGESFRGHRLIEHSGGSPGTSAYLGRFLDDQLTVIVLANTGQANAWLVGRSVAGLYDPNLLPPHMMRQQAVGDPTLRQQLLKFLAVVAGNQRNPSLMTAGMQQALDEDDEGRILTNQRLKAMKSFIYVDCEGAKGRPETRHGTAVTRTCFFKMETGVENRYYIFWLTAEGLVADYTSYAE